MCVVKIPAGPTGSSGAAAQAGDQRTPKDEITALIARHGPITAGDIAEYLQVTPAAVRRHLDGLQADGVIDVWEGGAAAPPRRGRPAKAYVMAAASRAEVSSQYADLAVKACEFIREHLGEEGLMQFARQLVVQDADRLAAAVAAAGDDPDARVQALADALNDAGHASSARGVSVESVHASDKVAPGIQLCQGQCPVHSVATRVPQICHAETEMFSQLLGTPVRRLATLAQGDRVCTTHIGLVSPGANRPAEDSPRPEKGQQ